MKSNVFWIIILSVVVILSSAFAFYLRQAPATMVNVYQNGELIETIDLSAGAQVYSLAIECEAGINVITVENGRVRVSEADCPDKLCVLQGWVSGGATPIVCLPHRLVIEPVNTGVHTIDAIVR